MIMKPWTYILLAIFLLAGGFVGGWFAHPMPKILETRIDTVFIRDTIRDTILIPITRKIARIDTVFLRIPNDTIRIAVEIPIERKVYKTDDYRAEIEGFQPKLVSMDIYRKTQIINTTQTIQVPDKKRWGLGVSAGYGATIQNGKIKAVPYVGIGIHYSIVQW